MSKLAHRGDLALVYETRQDALARERAEGHGHGEDGESHDEDADGEPIVEKWPLASNRAYAAI